VRRGLTSVWPFPSVATGVSTPHPLQVPGATEAQRQARLQAYLRGVQAKAPGGTLAGGGTHPWDPRRKLDPDWEATAADHIAWSWTAPGDPITALKQLIKEELPPWSTTAWVREAPPPEYDQVHARTPPRGSPASPTGGVS